MKSHIKPCNCEVCEKARYWEPCNGCKAGHPSFWKTVTESPQWKLWQKEQRREMTRDMSEVEECGRISPEHFQEFLNFLFIFKSTLWEIIKQKKPLFVGVEANKQVNWKRKGYNQALEEVKKLLEETK